MINIASWDVVCMIYWIIIGFNGFCLSAWCSECVCTNPASLHITEPFGSGSKSCTSEYNSDQSDVIRSQQSGLCQCSGEINYANLIMIFYALWSWAKTMCHSKDRSGFAICPTRHNAFAHWTIFLITCWLCKILNFMIKILHIALLEQDTYSTNKHFRSKPRGCASVMIQ